MGPRQIAAGWKTLGSCGVIGLGSGRAVEGGDLLPEMVQHRVGRGVPIVRPAMHLAAGDDVDAGHLLFEDRGLGGAQLRIGKVLRGELAERPPAGRSASYQRGTLWAPTTVVVYLGYRTICDLLNWGEFDWAFSSDRNGKPCVNHAPRLDCHPGAPPFNTSQCSSRQ